ncbi:choline transporter-like protein 4 isoform X2 [Pangasianodon hypophthalmus]|uniref:choline transporter-like protein 4 isoform X2 n=1 Tax=Pangasianodon hypophthalmus TaxID=310915 RepID=UPI002307F1B8|nr:choline transporter-like protein 4 isoform X2 [Pangasianodon hypophthalmus]
MGKKTEDKQQQNSEYGEPTQYDPTFNGPIHNRSCTDIICCVLFMLVLVGYMVVGILAWLYGDPRHVLYPRNSTGMYCGLPPNQDKPNVFYFNILKCATATNIMAAALQGLQCPTTQICVRSCPSSFWSLDLAAYTASSSDLKIYFKQELCVPSFNLSSTTLSATEIINRELCPFFYTPTSSVLGRCLPTLGPVYNSVPSNFSLPGMSSNQTVNMIKDATGDLLGGFNARDVGVRIFADFASTWQWIIVGLVIAMLISLLFLLLLRFLAAILVWVLIFGVLAVGAFGIWYCYNEYASLADSTLTYNNVGFTTNVNVYLQIRDTWLAFLIILCVVEAILLLILVFLRTRILIAIAVIQESSKAVGYMMSTLFYPIVTFVMLVVCVSYWGITALYLATSGGPVYNVVALNSSERGCSSIAGNQSCDPTTFNSSAYGSCQSARCVFIKYNTDGLFQRNLFNLQLYNVVGFLWCANFVIALGQCTLAGAFASYYWAFHKPSDIPACPLISSFMRALRYHVGSLAFGALILTLVQIVRIILEYLDHKFREAQNPCTRFLMCCLKCCFWCLEKFIKFINRNAYIMIAIYGKNFCVSARNAFSLLMRNIIRVVVLDKVTDLLLFFGKLLVVGGVGVLSFYFFTGKIMIPNSSFTASSLNYYWMPIIAVVFGAYLIASGFFSVYSMCVDTLFLCFLEDLERNDGSAEKPYYMSKNLMKILNKKNKQPKK